MSTTMSKRLTTVLKSALHIALYILLGLMLAFFINSTAHAAEPDSTEYTHYDEQTGHEDNANSGDIEGLYSEPTTEAITLPAADPTGRLLVYSRAKDTNLGLNGTVFVLHRTFDNTVIVELTTDMFGEAMLELPTGDYYLRKIAVSAGFVLNTDRINFGIHADEITEITVLSIPEPIIVPPPPPQLGRLLVTVRGDTTRENLQGAELTLYHSLTDEIAAQLTTDHFGEASVHLPAGDYFLRQISAPSGFILNTDRIAVRIQNNAVREINIMNKADPPPADDPPETQPGRLLVTVRAQGTGEKLQGVTFSLCHALTDAVIAELTTDIFGEASIHLPAGDYFLRQISTPSDFIINTDRIPVRIREGAATDISVTRTALPPSAPAPTTAAGDSPVSSAPTTEPAPSNQGRIEIVTRAASSGTLLSGGTFAVYRASDSQLIEQVTTGADGTAHVTVEPGMYFVRELRATYGFSLETERIFLEVGERETVVMELTKVRDVNIVDLPTDEDGGGIIHIPPTGQNIPMIHYMSGGLLIVTAFACGWLVLRELLSNRNLKSGRVGHD